jgi:uncharacterized membrane protein
MKNRFKGVEYMLLLSVSFTVILLIARVLITQDGMFLFLLWNIFLAIVPLLLSRSLLNQDAFNFKSACMLLCWLIFFPNAAYIITDLLHLTARAPIPKWYDLLLIVSAAWNGLVIGIVSLLQLEDFFLQHFKKHVVNLIVLLSLLSAAFGIYLGRFLRLNSWDVVTNPVCVYSELSSRFMEPSVHPRTWGFTFLFGGMLMIIHSTIKKISETKQVN